MHIHGNVSSKPGTWDKPSAVTMDIMATGTGGAAEKRVGNYGDHP